MKIGIVSDTHGNIANTLQAVALLNRHHVTDVLHCGDIGSGSLVPFFGDWRTHFVFGNCDYDTGSLRLAIQDAGQTCHGRFGELEIDYRKIAFLHSDDAQRFQETIESQKYDLVCYGHTHRFEYHLAGKTWVLNPGALYRAHPLSFSVVDLESMEVTQVPLENQN